MSKEKTTNTLSLSMDVTTEAINKRFAGTDETSIALKTAIKEYFKAVKAIGNSTWKMADSLRVAHSNLKAGFESETEFFDYMGLKQAYGAQLISASKFDTENGLDHKFTINKCVTLQAMCNRGADFSQFLEWCEEVYSFKGIDEVATVADKSLRKLTKAYQIATGIIEDKSAKQETTEATEAKQDVKREDILSMIDIYTDKDFYKAVDLIKWLCKQYNIKSLNLK